MSLNRISEHETVVWASRIKLTRLTFVAMSGTAVSLNRISERETEREGERGGERAGGGERKRERGGEERARSATVNAKSCQLHLYTLQSPMPPMALSGLRVGGYRAWGMYV